MQSVGADDEWVAEAYMETGYSKLSQADFERILLDYAVFSLSRSIEDEGDVSSTTSSGGRSVAVSIPLSWVMCSG